jgi:colanic acid biosynthesis glycosyl transferase WcaI
LGNDAEMKILLINQAFYPDVVSTAYHASELAAALARRGHEVTAIASRRPYDKPSGSFPKNEIWEGVRIQRLWSTKFGKKAIWRRLLDFGSFFLNTAAHLIRSPHYDVVIALTSPPLIASLAALLSHWRRSRLVYWIMDLNPDQAIAAGVLNPSSLMAKVLESALAYTLRRADRIVALDRFMCQRILARGIEPEKCTVVLPWSLDNSVWYDRKGRISFRREHGLEEKFVVMYSGNHSPCHPLDTLLEAARRLAGRPEVAFCFVGGGKEHGRVREYAKENNLSNIVTFPYQPTDRLAASLSAADLHVVVMGDPFLGIVHPCKIYNILRIGASVLYIGPSPSHVTDLAPAAAQDRWFFAAAHSDADAIVKHIHNAMLQRHEHPAGEPRLSVEPFSQGYVMPQLVRSIESLAAQRGQSSVASLSDPPKPAKQRV